MNMRLFHVGLVIFVIIAALVGWRTYHYFFDMHAPIVTIQGLDDGSYVANDITCAVCGSDAYKVGDLSIWLDGKLLVDRFKINASTFRHPFSIATRNLSNGSHTLKAQATNATNAQKNSAVEISFNVDNLPLQGVFIRSEADNKVFQGRTLHVQFQVNKEIKNAAAHTLSNTYIAVREAKNSPIYESFIPISCEEAPNEHLLKIEISDHVGNVLWLENKFQIVAFPFKRQQYVHVPAEKVKFEKESGRTEKELELELAELAKKSPQEKLWQGAFYPPIDIASVSTEYGTIRTTQERGRYMHKAVDVVNQPKSVVWATQDGNIVIKDRYEHSGNTVVIDHGCGIFSLFFHLDSFADITVGEKVKRGRPIGTIGQTGYARGYHLHWEMRINNEQVDPMQWTKPNF
jgi:murein DD-endopeptidase MepM/ murein hydrolase activator NlpD